MKIQKILITGLTILTVFMGFNNPPALANVGWQKGREEINFTVLNEKNQRPSWGTGIKDGSLTCERRFGTRGQKIPQSYLAQVINFDQTTVDQQRPFKNISFRFIWGNALKPEGRKGTISTLKRKHVLDLGSKNVYGVALIPNALYTREGVNRLKQETQNIPDFTSQIDKGDLGDQLSYGSIIAKCPDLPRKELSICEINGNC